MTDKNILDKENEIVIKFYLSLKNNEEKNLDIINSILNKKDDNLSFETFSNKKLFNKQISDLIKITYYFLCEKDDSDSITHCLLLLNNFKNKCKSDFKIYLEELISRRSFNYLCNFIQKYVIFIQTNDSMVKIEMMDFLNLLTSDDLSPEEIKDLKTSGLFNLILSYVKYCEIDYLNFFQFLNKVIKYDTNTISNFLELFNINFDLSNILSDKNIGSEETLIRIKDALFQKMNRFNLFILIQNKNIFSIAEILYILSNYPINKLRKNNLSEILNFTSNICVENEKYFAEESCNFLINLIISFLFLKRKIRISFLFSHCLNKHREGDILYKCIFTEFGLFCKNCNLNICIICVHRCHIEHEVTSLGYSLFKCDCYESNSCFANLSLEMPMHIQKASINNINEGNNKIYNNLNKNLNTNSFESSEIKIKKSFTNSIKESSSNNLTTKTTQSNLLISTDYETITYQTNISVCNINENIYNNNEDTIYYFEVDIISGGFYDQIAIGISSLDNYPKNEFAGYLPNSIGYHGDDGKCFVNADSYSYGVKYGSNDIIGCGITINGNVYFTHNGCILPLLDVRMKGEIFCLISIRGKYASVRINNNLENNFYFKHDKQKLYQNNLSVFNEFSKCFCNLLLKEERLLIFINRVVNKFSGNENLEGKYKILSDILFNFIKENDNTKYLVKQDIIKEEESAISPKFNKIISLNDLNLNRRKTNVPNNFIKINPIAYKILSENSKQLHNVQKSNESIKVSKIIPTKKENEKNNNCNCGNSYCTLY